MSSWAKPGVKCVCVDAGVGDLVSMLGMSGPVQGANYTIRDVIIVGGRVGLRLVEIINRPVQWREGCAEAAFDIAAFRPLVELSDDVAQFAHHLDRVREPA